RSERDRHNRSSSSRRPSLAREPSRSLQRIPAQTLLPLHWLSSWLLFLLIVSYAHGPVDGFGSCERPPNTCRPRALRSQRRARESIESQRREVRTRCVIGRCRLERLAQREDCAFGPRLANDLHAGRQAADEPGRLRQRTQAEIIHLAREGAWDRGGLVHLREWDRRYRHVWEQYRVVGLEPFREFPSALRQHAQILRVIARAELLSRDDTATHRRA